MKRTHRNLAVAAVVLAVNALLAAYWWISTEPDAYLWTRAAPGVTAAVREAGRAVFWGRWPAWALVLNTAIAATLLLRTRRRARAAAVFAAGVLAFAAARRWADPRLADDYFSLFQLQERPEPLIQEPIESAGTAIGPQLVDYIQRPGAKRMRYAVGGLGSIRYAPAVPELARILNDPASPSWLRSDARQALWSIGTRDARAAVRRFEATRTVADSSRSR